MAPATRGEREALRAIGAIGDGSFGDVFAAADRALRLARRCQDVEFRYGRRFGWGAMPAPQYERLDARRHRAIFLAENFEDLLAAYWHDASLKMQRLIGGSPWGAE